MQRHASAAKKTFVAGADHAAIRTRRFSRTSIRRCRSQERARFNRLQLRLADYLERHPGIVRCAANQETNMRLARL